MNALIGLLPFVALLACPLLMGLCFWGMRRMDTLADVPPVSSEPATSSTPNEPPPLADQIAGLEARLAQLRAEQDELAVQLAELAWQGASHQVAEEPRAESASSAPATIAQT